MKQLLATDLLNKHTPVVEADRRAAEIFNENPEGLDSETTHVAVLDDGRFCGLVGIKDLMRCPPAWIFEDLAAKGNTIRVRPQTPVEGVHLALQEANQTAAAVVDDAGKYVGAVTANDIQRRWADERVALAKIASRLAHFSIDRAPAAIAWVNADAQIVYVNEAACRWLGCEREDLVGKTVADVNPDFSLEAWPAHWEEIRRRGTFTLEAKAKAKDGRLLDAEVTVNYVHHDGREFTCSSVQDITDRKRAERKIRENEARLLEAQRLAKVGSWDLDRSTGSFHCSEVFFEICEMDKRGPAATCETYRRAVHPADREAMISLCDQSAKNGSPFDSVHRLLMPDGRIKHVHMRCENFKDKRGVPVRSVGTLQDISERVRQDAESAKLVQREALAMLAGGIAHEFNSTLLAAGIYLHGAPAGASGPDPSVAKAAALIQQAQSLSASLLELFAGPESVEIPVLPLSRWLPECVERLADCLPPGILVTVAPRGEIGLVRANALAIEQVLRILLTNASDAIADQGQVHVTWGPSEGAGGYTRLGGAEDSLWVEVRVIDQGHGVPEADRSRIFEPFYSTKNRSRRSGLGLAIAARLVEQSGGSLLYEPNEPSGSVFVVRLRTAL